MKKKSLKILIIRNDKIGDLILTTPVFREIKKHFPESKIVAVVSSSSKEIIEKNKSIDKIIVIDMPKRSLGSVWNYLRSCRIIKKENFDIGFDLRGSRLNTFFLLFLPRIKHRVSFINLHNNSLFLTKSIFLRNFYERHLTFENLEIINEGLGISSKDNLPEIATDQKDEKNVRLFIKERGLKEYICICPGASNKFKQWSKERFDELIKYIAKKYPKYKILLIGDKMEEPIINYLSKNKNCIAVIGLNLRTVYLLFKKSSFVITPEGGNMHLAGAANANLIVLLGYTYPAMNHQKPLAENLIMLYHEIKGHSMNNVRKDREFKGKDCINLITLEEVKRGVDKFLNKK